MRHTAVLASILTFIVGCDKPPVDAPPAEPLTDLSASPVVLFQVFGSRDAPRAAPIGIVANGGLLPLRLDETGWRALDSMVFTVGSELSLYHQGRAIGTGAVQRGMWTADGDALYELPGCRVAMPQADLTLTSSVALEESVELLASNVPFAQPDESKPLPREPEAPGRTIVGAVAAEAKIGTEDLEMLDFHARWLRTGAGAEGRTLLATYVDPNAGDVGPGLGNTTNIFTLAEDSAGVFNTSFGHVGSGEARTVESMRLVNHADLDGDGVAEILAEAWYYGKTPDLVLLTYREGRWHQTFRVPMDWCAQKRQ